MPTKAEYDEMREIAEEDVRVLEIKGQTYGDSWRKRGGVGAFMMLARKWDRLENQMESQGYDILTAGEKFYENEEGMMDDIRDLRRYLLLCEQHIREQYRKRHPPLTDNINC